MSVFFYDQAWEDYLYWQTQDKKTFKRLNRLIKDLQRDPEGGLGKSEILRHQLRGCYSRRIDKTHRLLYELDDGVVKIVQCRYHYEK